MSRIIIAFIILLCLQETGMAQQPLQTPPQQATKQQPPAKINITGTIRDSATGKPIPWATVGIYRATDTQKPLQNGFSGKKGEYDFTAIDTGHYAIFITSAGYRETEYRFTIDSAMKSLELQPIEVPANAGQLGGVTVTASARKPLIEQEEEKMIYNTEADPSLAGLTALDVFRKTPFLSVDGEGNVQLNGQSSFKVLLNGKETSMFTKNLKDALKSFPAALIKKIEVSTNPSAKYDGEGTAGIINIITQKKIVGYNGSAGASYNSRSERNINASFNLKYGKSGFSLYYGQGGGHPPRSLNSNEVRSLNPVAFYKRLTSGSSKSNFFYQYGNLEYSLDIDSLSSLSVYAGGNSGNGRGEGLSYMDEISADQLTTKRNNFSSTTRFEYPSLNIGSDYVRKSKRVAGREMTLRANYDLGKDESYANSLQDYPDLDRYVINDSRADNQQGTLQLDFTQPFKKGMKLETGVKAILRKASSDYQNLVKYQEQADYENDPSNTNNFRYHQDVYSLFATWSFKWKQISFRLGSRLERTHINGEFDNTATSVKQDYNTLLPNLYLSRKFNKIHTVSLSFGRRLRRPYIWDLNPFVSNTDSLNTSTGNPNLGPDIANAVEAGYSVFKGKTSISARITQGFSNRQITRYTVFNDQTGVSATYVDNAGLARVTSLNLNLSTKLNKSWSLSAGLSGRYTRIRNRFRRQQENSGAGGFANLNSSYIITKKWTVYGSGYYRRADIQLQGKTGGNANYSVGVNYKILNDKITLTLSGSNFLREYMEISSEFADLNFSRQSLSRNVQRNVMFGLQWNFGKLSENVSRKRGVSNDDLGR